jgi:HEAT repeat protein
MRRRNKLLIAIACALPTAALVLAVRPEPEPSYDGRPLSEWLHVCSYRKPEMPTFEEREKAVQAIRHIGTNTLPTLLRWISYDPSPARQKALALLRQLPNGLQPRFLWERQTRSFETEAAFYTLGPAARSAIPELTRLATTSTSEYRVYSCSRALSHIGPEALPAMLAIISNPQGKARNYPIPMLNIFRAEAGPAVPFLVACLEDKDDAVACAAAEVLGNLALSNSVAVPALATSLQSTNAARRIHAARALAEFGRAAEAIAPQLQRLLTDSSQSARDEARRALDQIAPEVVTNAPPQ